jgi:hypothetical protein
MDAKNEAYSKWLLVVILAVVFVSIIIHHFSNTPSTIKADTGVAVVHLSNTPATSKADVGEADAYDDVLEPQHVLVGLKGVWVCVSDFRTDVESYGLTKQRLQTDVELRLRQNGIKVISQEEYIKMPCTSLLEITVLYQPAVYGDLTKAPIYATSITTKLLELMRL